MVDIGGNSLETPEPPAQMKTERIPQESLNALLDSSSIFPVSWISLRKKHIWIVHKLRSRNTDFIEKKTHRAKAKGIVICIQKRGTFRNIFASWSKLSESAIACSVQAGVSSQQECVLLSWQKTIWRASAATVSFVGRQGFETTWLRSIHKSWRAR